MRRKLPPVMRVIAASASAVVRSSRSSMPRWGQCLARTNACSPVESGRVVMDKPDPAVELGVAGEAFLAAGHTDENEPGLAAVVVVAQLLQDGHLEPVGLHRR